MTRVNNEVDVGSLRSLHAGWISANRVGDTGWLRSHVAPEQDAFLMYNNNGSNYRGLDAVVSLWDAYRELGEKAVMSGPASLEDFDVDVRVSGDLGVVSYKARFKANFGAGGKVDEVSRGTEVWERRADGWVMVHFHASTHTPGVMGGE